MSRQVKRLTISTHRQLLRYGITGLISNTIVFIGYVLETELGRGHKAAMSLFYGLSVLQTFVFNRRWTFNHSGGLAGPFLRYVMACLVGYAANLADLVLFVDMADLSGCSGDAGSPDCDPAVHVAEIPGLSGRRTARVS